MKHRKLILFQRPNAPLIIAGLGWLTALFTTDLLHLLGQIIFVIALTTWSSLEVIKGTNKFRKLLGAVTLLFIAWLLLNHLI